MKPFERAARAAWPLAGLLGATALVATVTAVRADPLAQRAPADEGEPVDTLRLNAGARIEHDSNVVRAPAAVSDQATVLSAGVRLDKRYSLQRLTLDAQLEDYRFHDLSALDYRTLNYEGAWHFQVTPRVQGTASARRRQYRDLTDAALASQRVPRRVEREELLEAAWLAGGGWRALAGLDRRSSETDDPASLEADPRVRSARAGAGYEFASGSLATLQWRRGDGDYRDAQGPDFREHEPFATLRWVAGGRTTITARAGRLSRRHDADGARDFSGGVGHAIVDWVYSPKTRVSVGVSRDLGGYAGTGGGRIRAWRWFIEPVWRPSAKTGVRLRHAHESREWSTVSPAAPDAGRDDRTRWSALTLEWLPAQLLTLTASVRGERRESSLPAFDYRATIYSLGARFDF